MDWPTPTSARIQLSSFLDKLQCAVLPDEKRLAMTENDVQAQIARGSERRDSRWPPPRGHRPSQRLSPLPRGSAELERSVYFSRRFATVQNCSLLTVVSYGISLVI